VLKPETGVYVCLSHAGPELRRPLLMGSVAATAAQAEDDVSRLYNWKVACQTLPRLLSPAVEEPVKGAKPAKGAAQALSFTPASTFQEEENVFHLYVCSRL